MHQISAPQLSTVDLIDVLEARIASLRLPHGDAAPADGSAAALRAELERAEVSEAELARAMDVPHHELHAWISGRAEVPTWAVAATRLVALLPPSERRKLQTQPRALARESLNRNHPFSRIEEL
jgi:plasmid maintenance system antidote protein VapI